MENYRKKRKTELLCAVAVILLWGCFMPNLPVFGKDSVSYTSVTIEFRDADTGELFYTYVHPWQFAGKAYTYYMEEQIYQEGRGCYWYDEAHEETVTEIRSLSEKPGENRIVLYYKWYEMGEKQYAVTVTCKDADTEEIICSKVQLFEQQAFNDRIFCEGYYAYDMDYRIIGQSGETYLYDIGNVKNVPVTKVDKNAIKNQIVLYYKKGEIKEEEAVAEVYYKSGNSLLRKSFIAGLPVGEPYKCTDENVLQRGWRGEGQTTYSIWEPWCSTDIESLSANPKENTIKLQYIIDKPIGGWTTFVSFPVRYVDEATGKMIMEEKGYGKKSKMYYYRPVEVLHLADGRDYYFDNTCSAHVMQVDGNNCYQSEDDTYIAYGGITVYYRADKPFGTQADIRINYLDSATGQRIKTEVLSDAAVGGGYSYKPKKSFAYNGRLYTFDKKNAQNCLALQSVTGQLDMDRLDVHYTGKSLKKLLKTPEIKKLSKKGKKNAMLQISKLKDISGYQVVYAYHKDFKSAKKIFSKNSKVTLKKLKKGKKCYVKVRAYIQTDTGKVYGKYSKKKKISL